MPDADAATPPALFIPRWRKIALVVCMFLITGVNGFLQPFVPLYLSAARLSRQDYGLVMALGTGLALLIQPVLGRLSDRWDVRRPFMVGAAVCAALAYLGYPLAHGFWAFTALTAIGVNGFVYLNTVGGVLVGRMTQGTGKSGGAAYIGYRVWGSVGYILIGLTTVFLLNQHPTATAAASLTRPALDPVFHFGPLLFLVLAFAALFVPDGKRLPLPPSPPPRSGEGGVNATVTVDAFSTASPLTPPSPLRGGGLGGRGNAPEERANLDKFLLAYFLYQLALYGATAYLSLFMKELGAKPQWITAMFAAGVVSEVLVMTRVGKWTDTHGRRPALLAAFILMPLRLLLYIPATGPLWVLMVQILHGVNFGIVGTIAVVFVNDNATDTNRGTLQARLAAASGVGTAIGPITCGWISQHWGLPAMFAVMSAVGMAGAWVLATQVKESHTVPVPLGSKWRWLT